jgi:hypothetical protein
MIAGIQKLRSNYKSFDFFYPIIIGIMIFQLALFPGIRIGILTALVILVLVFKDVNKRVFLLNGTINKMILLYLIYNTGSLCWFFFTGLPVSVFFAEWSNSILPILFFYLAYIERKQSFNFYSITLKFLLISFILGFILWFWEPPFYRVFMDTMEGVGTDMLFFQSIFGLTATGALGVLGFLISAYIVFQSKGKKGKIALAICMLTVMLTFRRSAMAVLGIAIIALHYIGYFHFRYIKKRYFLLEAVVLYYIFVLISGIYTDFFTDLVERASMISEAFSERSDTWTYAFTFGNLIFGDGLGVYGHKAIGYSTVLISDGNYFKMLAEIGLIGTGLFLMIIICSLTVGFKDFRNKYLEISVVLGTCIMAIGSNIFTYQIIMPIFWYSIGRLSIDYKTRTAADTELNANLVAPKLS